VSISLSGICLKQNRKTDLKNWYPQKCSCNNEARTTTPTTTITEKKSKKASSRKKKLNNNGSHGNEHRQKHKPK
jgi:hypothetical protein